MVHLMLRLQLNLILAVVVLSSTVLADELKLDDQLQRDISPIVRDIEAAVLGKTHRPFESFLADDAVFEEPDSPLRPYLKRAAGKNKSFPATSSLHWLRLSDSMLSKSFQRVYPVLDPKQTVLVYREIERENKQLKAYGYILCLINDQWKVVIHFHGSGPEDGLAKKSQPFKLLNLAVEKNAFTIHEKDNVVYLDTTAPIPQRQVFWLPLGSMSIKTVKKSNDVLTFRYVHEEEGGYSLYECKCKVGNQPIALPLTLYHPRGKAPWEIHESKLLRKGNCIVERIHAKDIVLLEPRSDQSK